MHEKFLFKLGDADEVPKKVTVLDCNRCLLVAIVFNSG